MKKELTIQKMQKNDVDRAVELWLTQCEKYGEHKDFPDYWRYSTREIRGFLNYKIDKGGILAATSEGELVGYLAYDIFPFHSEKTVFCPAIGHAAIEADKEWIYLSMYKEASRLWVMDGIFNHLWTIFNGDETLRETLFTLGYGSYLVDAFGDLRLHAGETTNYQIKKVEENEIEALEELIEESREYYSSAPLFLMREEISHEEIKELVEKSNVFMAWHKDVPVGFINLGVTEETNPIDLSVKGCGMIDEIGAYIKEAHRGNNAGREMLAALGKHCRENDISCVHVDFETANLYANKFWRKYFTPMLISMRRGVNRDARL